MPSPWEWTDAACMAFLALVDGALRPPAAEFGRHPSLALRLRVRLHRLELTERLAECADPLSSPELALRAHQLSSPREVRGCIKGVERALREAAAPSFAITAQAPLQRREILAARPFLVNLRRRLRETENPEPRASRARCCSSRTAAGRSTPRRIRGRLRAAPIGRPTPSDPRGTHGPDLSRHRACRFVAIYVAIELLERV